ncbi:hypothetical protein EII17_12775 [Clostridiales bacterium COT073_COT-073]|nr:hypothetical protein EII17_12775 [Clostridiales bacterium COT073_COT-073]
MLDLILGILWLIVAVLVYIEKKDMVMHIENVALIYMLASAAFFGRYLYFRRKKRKERTEVTKGMK